MSSKSKSKDKNYKKSERKVKKAKREKKIEDKNYDLLILGSGVAGLSAGIYAARYKLKTLIIGKDMGMAAEAPEIENYPGIYGVSGVQLVKKITEHAREMGAEIIYDEIENIEKIEGGFKVKTSTNEFFGKAIIYALGGMKRKLGLENENNFIGKGISYCATCDSRFFKDKIVAVLGGANSAATTSLLLSKYAKKVYLIHRRESLRADPTLIEKLKEAKNIEIIFNHVVKELKGDKRLEAVILENVATGEKREIKLDGIFVEFGYVPNSFLAEKIGVEICEDGRIKVNEDMSTNIEGFFAAGDITSGSNRLDQIITAAAEGAIAANSAYKYLSKK
ncbi:MAG: FAD-dependent oxidoreductase [Candidatus Aenigmatarchaeota archaeon]|nr:FAD-dependent oxidoreductase [Candidatus Aenigmarchaeota archaeon]